MAKLPFETVKRKILTKRESTPSEHGMHPIERPIQDYIKLGIINLDKPRGPSSHQVSDYVKQVLNVKRAGHSGTLDPNVTGILPIGLEESTKIMIALLTAGKEYICSMHLHKKVSPEEIKKVFKKFTGTIKQLPPIHSAVKRQWRQRKIYYLDLLEIDEQEVLFRVGCEAGTYIRKLCHDIGASLKVGAHMAELRRTKAGPFDESTICTLQDVADAYHYYTDKGDEKVLRKLIMPVEAGVFHLPKIIISDDVIYNLTHGATLHVPGVVQLESGIKKDDDIAIMSLKGELVALAEARMSSEEVMSVGKGVAAKTQRVIMDVDLYPKFDAKK